MTYKKNTSSDQKFAQDTITKLTVEKDGVTALVDGVYYSEEIAKKAKSKNIKMVPTSLVGGGKNNNGDKFEIKEKEHTVKKCPSGHQPITSAFKEEDPIEHTLIRNTVVIFPYVKIVR